jgi:hypothetical protein
LAIERAELQEAWPLRPLTFTASPWSTGTAPHDPDAVSSDALGLRSAAAEAEETREGIATRPHATRPTSAQTTLDRPITTRLHHIFGSGLSAYA